MSESFYLTRQQFARIKDWRRIVMDDDRYTHTIFSTIRIAATVSFDLSEVNGP